MPIREENRARYPAEWKAISLAVREAAGQRCEQCNVRNHAIIFRGFHGDRRAYRYQGDPVFLPSRCALDGSELLGTSWDDFHLVGTAKVILTVAHLDHQPENCARENLKALCQRCHNAYDAPMRRAGIRDRYRSSLAVGDLLK